jgi:hypothetical protein
MVATCVWGIIGACLGANNTPINATHYKILVHALLPHGGVVYHFGFAAVCWVIWKCRNRVIFYKKIIKHPTEIILHACAYMLYWVGLFSADYQGDVEEGLKKILVFTHRILVQQGRPTFTMLPPTLEDRWGMKTKLERRKQRSPGEVNACPLR